MGAFSLWLWMHAPINTTLTSELQAELLVLGPMPDTADNGLPMMHTALHLRNSASYATLDKQW